MNKPEPLTPEQIAVFAKLDAPYAEALLNARDAQWEMLSKQEPVAYVVTAQYEDGSHQGHRLEWRGRNEANDFAEGTALYTHPAPQQERVLIDGSEYSVHPVVAGEMLRLHLLLRGAAPQQENIQALLEKAAYKDENLAARKTVIALGYKYHGGELWKPPLGPLPQEPNHTEHPLEMVRHPQINGWIKKSEFDQAMLFGGSINLWLERHDCDTRVFIEAAHGIKDNT